MSDIATYLSNLQNNVDVLKAVSLVIAGALSLMMGWKIFKVLITANALLVGMVVGMSLGGRLNHPNMDVIMGIAFGLLFAAVAWPMMKWSVSVLGGLAGGAVGYLLWRYVCLAAGQQNLAQMGWVGGVIGLITLSLLAFIMFKVVVMSFTAFEGSFFLVSGVIALLMKAGGLQESLRTTLTENEYLLPLLVLVPAVLGGIFQQVKFGKSGPKPGGAPKK